jgi:mannosyltransferase
VSESQLLEPNLLARDNSAPTDARNYKVWLAAIIALALVLRLPGINESIWYDELWSTRVILDSVEALMRVVATDPHPPFYSAVMFVWIRLFGDTEVSLRILPLICGLLTILLTARLAAAYGGTRAALVAALVLAISPPHIWYSQEARQYSLLLLLLTGCTWAFHRIRHSHATRWYVAYAVFALCMVLTHYFAIAYLAAFTLLSLGDRRARVRMLWIGGAIGCVLVVYLAARWRFTSLPTQLGHLREFGITDPWNLMFEWYVIGGALDPPEKRVMALTLAVLAMQLVILALVVRGLLRAQVTAAPNATLDTRWTALARRWELALLLLILPLALLTMGLLGAKQFYIERGAITGLPFFAIAVGVGARSFPSARLRALTVVLIAAFGALVLVNYYAQPDRWTVYMPHPDWRKAAQWLEHESSGSRRPVVIVSLTPALELLYYDRGFALIEPGKPSAGAAAGGTSEGSIRERLRRRFPIPVDPLRGRTGRIYMLQSPDLSLLNAVLDREHVSEFFVVTNRFIRPRDRLRDAIAADRSFNVEAGFEPRGIRLLRVRRNVGDAQGP